MPLWQTIVAVVLCLAVLVSIPVVLMVVFGRRRRRMEAFIDESWTATVVDFDYKPLRVHTYTGYEERPLCIEVRYRREDGIEGMFRIAGEGGAHALAASTLQPLPPEGLYDEVDKKWVPGMTIRKQAGAYYPELVL